MRGKSLADGKYTRSLIMVQDEYELVPLGNLV